MPIQKETTYESREIPMDSGTNSVGELQDGGAQEGGLNMRKKQRETKFARVLQYLPELARTE